MNASIKLATTLAFGLLVTASSSAAESVYELRLRHASGGNRLAPVSLVLHERDGEFLRGAAIAPHLYPEPAQTFDFSGLKLSGNRVTGTVTMQFRTAVYNQHPERPQKLYEAAFTINVAFNGNSGRGVASFNRTANGLRESAPVARGPLGLRLNETAIEAVRRPIVDYPDDVQFELPVYHGHDQRQFGWMNFRFTTHTGKADSGYAVYGIHRTPHGPVDTKMQFDGRSLRGSLTTNRNGDETKFEIDGIVIDRFVFFQAKIAAGERKWSCGGHGRVNLAERRLPEAASGEHHWQVEYTSEPDAALVQEAIELSNRPLGALEPTDETLLWTWRLLVSLNKKAQGKDRYVITTRPISVIHPPAFDLAKVAQAEAYRFTLSGEGATHAFVSAEPTTSLAPVWAEMQPGDYTLTVTPLDKSGTELPVVIEARHQLADEHGATISEIGTTPVTNGIPITKRVAFQGPYFTAPRDGYKAVLAKARYFREAQHIPAYKGLLPYPGLGALGGDGKQNYRLMNHSFCNLLVYRLSDDPEEQAEALRSALHAAEAGEHDLIASPADLVGTYKFNTNTHNVAGEAFLNLYEFTGDERWKAAALRFARGLARFQKPNGTFEWVMGSGKVYEQVESFAIRLDIEPNPSELLAFYGRLRHELKTDEFVQVERKALDYLRKWKQQQFTWLEVGPHSWPWAYPLKIHSRSPQHLALYLVAYADDKDRDLKLAEELALWSEDRNVSWERIEPSDGQQVGPHGFGSCDGYRSSGPPVSFVSRLALVYLHLHKHTGRRLHLEKARALFASVIHSQHAESGYLNRQQVCKTAADDYPPYKHTLIGDTLRYLYDYETEARQLSTAKRP